MKPAAHVKSIDSLRVFRSNLKRYLEATRSILEGLKVESNRAMNWVEHDQSRYWPRAAKRSSDRLVEARNALLRCKMAAVEGQSKSCVDEKKEVEAAVARLRYCERQVRIVRQWRQKMRHSTEEFSGKIARLSSFVEDELPKAIASLDRRIAALDKYAEQKTSTESSPSSLSTQSDDSSGEPSDPTVIRSNPGSDSENTQESGNDETM